MHLTDNKNHDFIITIHPDFPNRRSSDHSFPFLDATRGRMEEIQARSERLQWWHNISVKKSKDLKMIYKNYRLGEWKNVKIGLKAFQKGSTPNESKFLKSILPEGLPLKKESDKLQTLYRALDICLFPIFFSDNHVDLVKFLQSYLNGLKKSDGKKYIEFLEYLDDSGYLKELQDKAFNLTFNFFELKDDLSPIIFEWDPEHPNAEFPSDSKITSNIDFDKIKSFYVDGFETLSYSLFMVLGLINLKNRNSYDTFAYDPNPRNKTRTPILFSLNKFTTIPNAPKFNLLSEDAEFEKWIKTAIDSKLRNGIGHYGIKFDTTSGDITYYLDLNKSKSVTISYGEYLFRCMKQLVRVYQVNTLVEMLSIDLLAKK